MAEVLVSDDLQRQKGNADRQSLHSVPRLPTVSVIIVNYNYGKFLREALTSVLGQSYPNVECILVDNGSTDESHDVIAELLKIFCFKVIKNTENKGQTGACLDGFLASSGEYVVFLDADDYLLQRAIETHVYVHLSLRIPVGFTSGDMLQCVDDKVVVCTSPPFADFVRSGAGRKAGLLRPIDDTGLTVWTIPCAPPVKSDAVHFRTAPNLSPWIWSATSANCFRRDALLLLFRSSVFRSMPSGTDVFLLHGVSALTGSVLIDQPLAVYRLHGSNVFSRHPALNGVRHYSGDSESSNTAPANKALIDTLLTDAAFFVSRLHRKVDLIWALNALNRLWPPIRSQRKGCRTYLAERLVENAAAVASIYGVWGLIAWMLYLRISPRVIFACTMTIRRQSRFQW